MLDGKAVLVTGGTGSFGKAFVRTVLERYTPKRLIVYSRDELKQHEMREELSSPAQSPLRFFLGDVRDRDRLCRAFQDVDVVVHAAALKQVPACEYNPFEAVNTNILGTQNVLDAAIDQGVERVLAISTDKAVAPANLYGATKLCAEKIVIQANAYDGSGNSRFACCRYGNVIGSRGSVLPVFLKQRKQGVVTVTDPNMTRFWLTISQGVQFVLSCLKRMSGGELFVPKIPSMSVMDFAKAVAPGCEIKVVGIRPGEKLHEVLISEDESRNAYEFDDHFVILPAHSFWQNSPLAGQPVDPGFRYSSDSNTQWLTQVEFLTLIRDMGYDIDNGSQQTRKSA